VDLEVLGGGGGEQQPQPPQPPQRFGVVLDRGSLVAIEPSLRHEYITTIGKLIAPGGKILLITLERRAASSNDPEEKEDNNNNNNNNNNTMVVQQGPPYSISEANVRTLYGSLEWVQEITVLEQENVLEKDPSQRERFKGLEALMEIAFLIQVKP
jgi:hypothetical protein